MTELPRKVLLSLVVSIVFTSQVFTSVKANSRVAFFTNVFDGTISGKVTKADGVTPIAGATVLRRVAVDDPVLILPRLLPAAGR